MFLVYFWRLPAFLSFRRLCIRSSDSWSNSNSNLAATAAAAARTIVLLVTEVIAVVALAAAVVAVSVTKTHKLILAVAALEDIAFTSVLAAVQ